MEAEVPTTRSRRSGLRSASRFNGAATSWSRKAVFRAACTRRDGLLQWGRDLSVAEKHALADSLIVTFSNPCCQCPANLSVLVLSSASAVSPFSQSGAVQLGTRSRVSRRAETRLFPKSRVSFLQRNSQLGSHLGCMLTSLAAFAKMDPSVAEKGP